MAEAEPRTFCTWSTIGPWPFQWSVMTFMELTTTCLLSSWLICLLKWYLVCQFELLREKAGYQHVLVLWAVKSTGILQLQSCSFMAQSCCLQRDSHRKWWNKLCILCIAHLKLYPVCYNGTNSFWTNGIQEIKVKCRIPEKLLIIFWCYCKDTDYSSLDL